MLPNVVMGSPMSRTIRYTTNTHSMAIAASRGPVRSKVLDDVIATHYGRAESTSLSTVRKTMRKISNATMRSTKSRRFGPEP